MSDELRREFVRRSVAVIEELEAVMDDLGLTGVRIEKCPNGLFDVQYTAAQKVDA